MRRFAMLLCVAVSAAVVAGPAVFGQDEKKAQKKAPAKKPNAAFAPIEDDPNLPRVLLLGDSISIGYMVPTRELLAGKANVHRPATNCGPTTNGVANIDAWLGAGKWDVIHFNFGLHDLKHVDAQGKNTSKTTGKHQVSLEDYEKNLETIVGKMKKTGAVLIFATTTPVPDGENMRLVGDDLKYNETALKVMKRHDVLVDDLHAYALARQKEIQLPKNVHFTAAGSKTLAEEVAKHISKALEARKQ